MASYNIYEAKTAFSQLVADAEAGKETTIARAGKPVAKIVPIGPLPAKKLKARDWGKNLLGVTYIAPDFGEPVWSDEELEEMGF